MSENDLPITTSDSVGGDAPEADMTGANRPEAKAAAKAEKQAVKDGEMEKMVADAERARVLQSDPPAATQSDQHNYDTKIERTRKALDKEPKVRVRIPKNLGPQTVIVNGARFNIPANLHVEVPQSVANLLEGAELV